VGPGPLCTTVNPPLFHRPAGLWLPFFDGDCGVFASFG